MRFSKLTLALSILFLTALLLRSLFALIVFGSYDTEAWLILSKIINCGYRLHTSIRYPYPPFWEIFLTILYPLEKIVNIPFYYLIKILPVFTDGLIVIMVYLLSLQQNINKKSALFRCLLYTISTVSILITSFHGQFDSITILFVLIAIYYLQLNNKYDLLISSFFLGMSAVTKPWTVILIPLFLFKIQSIRNKMVYLFSTVSILLLSLIPYLITDYKPFIRDVFLYSSTRDFGLAVVLDYFSINNIKYLGDINTFLIANSYISKLGLISGLFVNYFWIFKKKASLVNSIVITLLVFYSLSTGVGAQYLYWIIPFLLISNVFWFKFYSVFATFAIIASYYWHNTNAFTIIFNPGFLSKGNYVLPWGFSVVAWWSVCLIILTWYILKLKQPKTPILINKNSYKNQIIIFLSLLLFSFSLLVILPKGIMNIYDDRLNNYYVDKLITTSCHLNEINKDSTFTSKIQNLNKNDNKNNRISLISILLLFTLLSLFIPGEKRK